MRCWCNTSETVWSLRHTSCACIQQLGYDQTSATNRTADHGVHSITHSYCLRPKAERLAVMVPASCVHGARTVENMHWYSHALRVAVHAAQISSAGLGTAPREPNAAGTLAAVGVAERLAGLRRGLGLLDLRLGVPVAGSRGRGRRFAWGSMTSSPGLSAKAHGAARQGVSQTPPVAAGKSRAPEETIIGACTRPQCLHSQTKAMAMSMCRPCAGHMRGASLHSTQRGRSGVVGCCRDGVGRCWRRARRSSGTFRYKKKPLESAGMWGKAAHAAGCRSSSRRACWSKRSIDVSSPASRSCSICQG